MLVPRRLVPRIHRVVDSLALHADHCALLNENVHTAGVAAARVRHLCGGAEYNRARRAHRARNVALHCGLSLASPAGSASLRDPVFEQDPWAGYPPSPPPLVEPVCRLAWAKYNEHRRAAADEGCPRDAANERQRDAAAAQRVADAAAAAEIPQRDAVAAAEVLQRIADAAAEVFQRIAIGRF